MSDEINTNDNSYEEVKKKSKNKGKRKAKTSSKKKITKNPVPKYPKYSLEKSLRIPQAILDQNAGKECSDKEAAAFVGVGYGGPFQSELSSAIRFGLLERTSPGKVLVTELGKKILRPQKPEDEVKGLREAILNAPDIKEVYMHYRGENLPDKQFFVNALVDTFSIPQEKVNEFIEIFNSSLNKAKLLEDQNGKMRVLDISQETSGVADSSETIKKLGKSVTISSNDTCFVMMPFAPPIGDYYSKIYEPAIKKAGLRPMRADDEIFGAGKIVDQIWNGLNNAKVLIAELTERNPNVFYELGLAHALNKPVVLISSNEEDVPFDLHHIRVIYYDVNDPFWGNKLIEKVAENILSAIKNPEEAIFTSILKKE